MTKVAMIGAGSIGFTRRLLMDILAVPELRDAEFRLMDIDPDALQMASSLCGKMVADNSLPVRVIATQDRREALKDADFVICTIRVGGLEAFARDIEIPLKYGVDQCVGDTLGPGGIFYAQRTIPVLLDIAKDMREVCPAALLLNYSNPMAMNCMAVNRAGGICVIGLCHSVQHAMALIAATLGLPEEDMSFLYGGINHQTWFTQVAHKGKDITASLPAAFRANSDMVLHEPVRLDILERFGYWSTETNGHLSEYLPWYRKGTDRERWVDRSVWAGGETGGYLRQCREGQDDYKRNYEKWMSGELDQIPLGERSLEHGSFIIESLVTGREYTGSMNVVNRNYVTNLPNGSMVEIPVTVDGTGFHPQHVGDLPVQCVGTCAASIWVQEMSVRAALTGDVQLLKLAVMHDPLTAALLSPDEVWSMTEDMLEGLAEWLPQYNGKPVSIV